MAIRPGVTVTEDTLPVMEDIPGMGGRIAVIGAFNSEITDITVCTNEDQAHQLFGTTATLNDFKGTDDIDFLFMGASELVIANITTWDTSGDTPVAETTLTTAKLQAALSKLHNEVFDFLFVADELADASQTIVSTWLEDEFESHFAHGQVLQLTKSSAAAYATSVATLKKNVYFINTQNLTVNGTTLNLNQSTAFIAGLIASMQVNKSLTAKILTGVSAISPEYTFETGDLGTQLLELNVPMMEVRNRRLQQIICINSMMPNGYDMSINRTRDYVINRIEAERLLGESNSTSSVDVAQLIVEKVRKECVDDLKLLKDIKYHITKTGAKTADIVLDELRFDDIITRVNIHFNIVVGDE